VEESLESVGELECWRYETAWIVVHYRVSKLDECAPSKMQLGTLAERHGGYLRGHG
jgi:hypothetical protein